MPVRTIVKGRIAVVPIRIVTAMTVVVAVGMMVIDPNVLVHPYVLTVINVDVDVVIPIPTLGIDLVTRVFN